MDWLPPSDLPVTKPALRAAHKQARVPSAPQPNAQMAPPSAQGWASRLLNGDGLLIVALIFLPILIHLPEILGIVHANAIGYTAMLGSSTPGFIGGNSTIDPNIGFTSQALGAQAAQQWFSGHAPWWNPYEGVGTPLAGEMQSAAFFPLTLLLIFPWGQTAFHIALQIISGIATYYLLRELRLSRTASLTGAVLFEFNGVFAWLANAVVNPVPFLPLLLLGIERAFLRARDESEPDGGWRWSLSDLLNGWKWIAVALGLSLLAGFPEVAYLDGLLAALWFVARLFVLNNWNGRARFALKSGIGLVVGIALAAPALVAFADFLPVAFLSEHGTDISSAALSNLSLAQYVHPYIFGNIFQYTDPVDLANSWGSIGGYLGASVIFLALMGLFGRRERGLRIVLAIWIALGVGRSVGAEPFAFIINKIPMMSSIAVYRYANASWVMAAFVLSAFAIDDWRGSQSDKIKATLAAAFTLCVVSLGSIWLALPQLNALLTNPAFIKKYAVGSIAIEWAAIIFLLVALLIGKDAAPDTIEARSSTAQWMQRLTQTLRARPHAVVMGVTVMALSIGYFFLPTLANPRHVTVDYAAVNFMKQQGTYSRFYTLGPFWPNYGAYFDVASINHNDLPVSQLWVTYINAHLDPYANPILFLPLPRDPSQPSATDELITNMSAFEGVGVKYIVTSPGQQPFAKMPAKAQPTLVYQDSFLWIYQLPAPAPLFSADGNHCQVQVASWTEANTTCESPSTLTFRTLTDPGWHATVNGHEVAITPYKALFQQIPLAAGVSQITFWYEPKHGNDALLIAAVAFLALLGAAFLSRWLTSGNSPSLR